MWLREFFLLLLNFTSWPSQGFCLTLSIVPETGSASSGWTPGSGTGTSRATSTSTRWDRPTRPKSGIPRSFFTTPGTWRRPRFLESEIYSVVGTILYVRLFSSMMKIRPSPSTGMGRPAIARTSNCRTTTSTRAMRTSSCCRGSTPPVSYASLR